MKKSLLVITIFLLVLSLVGCGDGGSKPPTDRYTIKISLGDSEAESGSFKSSSFIAQGIDAAGDPVPQSPDWFKAKTVEDHLYGADFIWSSAVRGAAAQATIYDNEGQPVTLAYEEAEASIVWTCSDPSKISLHPGDGNMTGDNVTFEALDTGVLNFTATYTYTVEGQIFTTTARANVIIINRPLIDLGGTYADFPEGIDFINGTGATIVNADIYYTKENGVNYINAPGGISKIVGIEYLPPTGTEPTISDCVLGSILRVPSGLTFETKVPADAWCSYIVRPRSGVGYAKIFNLVSLNMPLNQLVWLQYEYSADGEFQLHW
jgi:predicted small lipoprotein YifL